MNYTEEKKTVEFPPCSWSYVDPEGHARHIVYVYGTSFKDGNELPAAGCGVSFGKIAGGNNLFYGLEDDLNPRQVVREVQDALQAESAGLYLAFSEIMLRMLDGNRYEIRTNSHKALELRETWKKLPRENYVLDSYNGNKAADFTVKALQVEEQLPKGAVTLKVMDPKVDEDGVDTAFNLAWDGINDCLNRRRKRQTNNEWKDKFMEETVEAKASIWDDVS